MDITLRIFLIIGILIFLVIILQLLKKKKLNLKYTLVWLLSAFVMLVAAIFPGIVNAVARLIGIISPVNFVFVLEGMFVLLILLSLTAIVSHINNRIYKLIQSLAILEKRVRELEEEKSKENNDVA
jgi:hypothetical protein